jgi:hypothetical protein
MEDRLDIDQDTRDHLKSVDDREMDRRWRFVESSSADFLSWKVENRDKAYSLDPRIRARHERDVSKKV